MKAAQLLILALILMLATPALAKSAKTTIAKRERIAVDSALNDSFKEHDQVQRTFKKTDGARREKPAPGGGRLQLEVGDEFGGSGGGFSSRSGSEDGMNFRGASQTDDEKVNVDQEMGDINASVKKDMDRNPTQIQDEE